MERIARLAGVNKQLLFYYYRSKRGLFQAEVRRGMAELEAALAATAHFSGRPLDRLRQLLTTLYELLEQHPDLVALLAHAERPDGAPFAPPVRRIVVLLAEGQGLGLVRDDVDPHVAAAQALILMLGYLRLEPLIAASAVDLVVNGVRAG